MFVVRKSTGTQKLSDFEYASGLNELVTHMDALGSSTLLTGSVQLVGLSKIRAKLGSAWDEIATKAAGIAEAEIDRRLGPTDIYRPEDDGYLICFDHLDEIAANRVAREISDAIEERLIEQLTGLDKSDLSVTAFVAQVPTVAFRSAVDTKRALLAALELIRAEVQVATEDRPIDRTLTQATVFYQPIWSGHEQGKTHNRSVLDPLSGAAVAAVLEEFDNRHDLATALGTLDCVMLARSVEGLHRALRESKRSSIIIPVHFSTLSEDLCDDLLTLGRATPLAYQKFLCLDVIGVPASAGVPELVKAAKLARQISEHVIFQIAPTDSRVNEAFLEFLWGLSINLGEIDTDDAAVQRELVRFAAVSAESGLHSFAYGANTLGRAISAVRAKFDYVGGSAVHNTVAAPRPHSRFSPLFGDLITKMRKADPGSSLRTHARFAPLNPVSVLTLPDGTRQQCRVVDVSASGAAISTQIRPPVGTVLGVGALPAQVIKHLKSGIAVVFVETQQVSQVEAALLAPFQAQDALRTA